MGVSTRRRLGPGAALALAGALALSPAMVAPPAVAPTGPAVPAVHIEDIRLAGIGQDIYYAVTPTVQYAVGGFSYVVNFLPIIGGPSAAQININYFQGIQPVVEATVNAMAAVVQDPLNIIGTLTAYGSTLYDIGYNWVSAQLQWLGLAPLPPLPPLASIGGSSAPTAPARSAARSRSAAAVEPGIGTGGRTTRAGVVGSSRRAVAAAAAEAPGEVRSTARAARGQVSRAAVRARAAAGFAAGSAR